MINEDTPSGYIERPTKGFTSSFTDIEDLGCHGFNHLYKAKRNGKLFILKSLSDDLKESVDFQLVLQKEFELASAIDHPNIVNVHYLEDVAEIGWCIVMDCIDGVTLSDFLKEKHPAKVYDKIVSELLDAMGYLHSKQIIHADLKPSNVMVTHNGNFVKLIDFGLSDADHYAELKNHACTEGYASPEQKNGEKLDCRSDIYSFGKILQAGFPKKYQSIARKCTRLNPDRRFRNTTEIQEAIRRKKAFSVSANVLLIAAFVFAILFIFNNLKIEKVTNNDVVSNNQEIIDTKEIKHFEVVEKPKIIVEKTVDEEEKPVVAKKSKSVNVKESEPTTIKESEQAIVKETVPIIIKESEPNVVYEEKPNVKSSNNKYFHAKPDYTSTFSADDNNTLKLDIVESDGKFGLLNGSKTVMPFKFDNISIISRNKFICYFLAKTKKGYGTFAVYTSENKSNTLFHRKNIIEFEYDTIIPFYVEHLREGNFRYYGAIVKRNGKYGYLSAPNAYIDNPTVDDFSHELILDCKYDEVDPFCFVYLSVCFRIGEKWGITCPGFVTTQCEYDEKPIRNHSDIILVYKGKTGAIHFHGNLSIPFDYECFKPSEEIIRVRKNGKYAYILENPWPENETEFDERINLYKRITNLQKDEYYIYDYAEDFHDGKALVEKDGKRFYITKDDIFKKQRN